jgi:hypothetical protein
MQMELPPGVARATARKDYVDHPDTARRIAEVEAIRTKLAGAGRVAGAGSVDAVRNVVARTLPRPNERIDEPFATRHRRSTHEPDMTDPPVNRSPRQSNPPHDQSAAMRRSHRRRAAPQRADQRAALQPAGARQHSAHANVRVEEADGMTLFIALNEIREKQDASLQFDFVCRAGICGSCAMVINGRPGSPAGR